VVTIFLAHAAADRDHALALASGLRSAGHAVLSETPLAGDNGWWAGLLAAVQDTDVVLYATPPGGEISPGGGTPPGSATVVGSGKVSGEVPVVVAALRDYAAAIGIPTLEVHLSGAGEATGIDFRRPTADAAFLLVGAIAALPERPPAVAWRASPESPFARVVDLAREVGATMLAPSDQRALVDRLRGVSGDPAVRELAAIFRRRPDLDAGSAKRLDEAFPTTLSRPSADGRSVASVDDPVTAGPGSGGPWVGETPWRPPAGGLSADDVRSISFRKPPFGRRGYAEQEVDEFLDRVEADLRARHAGGAVVKVMLTAGDVHEVVFMKPPRGRRGYDEEQVDAFLDEIERTIAALDQALVAHGSAVSKG
jgi:DivIVA domain-containing protein